MNARTPDIDLLKKPVSMHELFNSCEQLQQQGKPFEAMDDANMK
jgi:hypothetical protein